MTKGLTMIDPDAEISAFDAMMKRDARFLRDFEWKQSWEHLERRLAQGALQSMSFDRFLGQEHLHKFASWIDKIAYPDYLDPDELTALKQHSLQKDQVVFDRLGLNRVDIDLGQIAKYNAQDFRLMRAYPVPDHQKIRTFLDFGAGHGRQAALGFYRDSNIERFIAMDAIPASYLTQRIYYSALGLKINDYMEVGDAFTVSQASNTISHLPSWRGDLIPDASIDMVCVVQVLRELSKPMLLLALSLFARVVKPGGGLYIRDHIGFHNVNQVDLDATLRGFGFVLEWQPHVTDRIELHGIPRIWRKADPIVLIGGIKQGA